jgi:hypothetical protein
MTHVDALGWLAASLMLLTFLCRDVRWLRALAMLTNLAFMSYGFAAGVLPVLVLHAVLLPLNASRLLWAIRQARRSTALEPRRPSAPHEFRGWRRRTRSGAIGLRSWRSRA